MNLFDWFREYTRQASARNDPERSRLLHLYYDSNKLRDSDPDRRLAMLEEGRALAERLREPWWTLFFDHWYVQTLMFSKRDYTRALERAVRSIVEVQHSRYARFPMRFCIHEDVINAYLGTDPEASAATIEAALDAMATEVTPDLPCYFCHQSLRTESAFEQGQIERALERGLQYVALIEANAFRHPEHTTDHHLFDAYYLLCPIAARLRAWERLMEWSTLGEQYARKRNRPLELVEFRLWQACATRYAGDEQHASSLYMAAMSEASRFGALPGWSYYVACSLYHELGGEHDRAFQVWGTALKQFAGTGQIAREYRCRLERCRLLRELEQPLQAELDAAREVARRRSHAGRYLAELDELARRGGEPTS